MPLSRLSILIVTYKGDQLLSACLRSVLSACGGAMPETVVVDNSPSEATRELVAAFPNVCYVRAESNLGFAGGNNLGLPFCTKEFVLLLNNDTVVHEEPFTHLVRYLEEHPGVAAVQGRMILSRLGGVLDDCGSMLTPLGIQFHRYFLRPDSGDLAPAAVFAAKGACLMFRRSALASAGGFLFHDHFRSYYEESDFCHRLWLAGHEVHFVPSPAIDHLLGQTSSQFRSDAIWRQYLSNTLFSFFSLFGAYGLFRTLPGFLALAMLQAGQKFLSGDFRGAMTFPSALVLTWRRRAAIRAARRVIRPLRVRTDRELFAAVLHRPRLAYYYCVATGKIGSYRE